MRHIALEVPLRALAVVGRWQRHHPAHARVQALRDAFDHAALARRVAPLEHDHHLVPGGLHPVLQLHQFGLQAEQFAEIRAPVLLLPQQGIRIEIANQRIHVAVLHLHFQLFVVAVHEVVVNAGQQLVVAVKHGRLLARVNGDRRLPPLCDRFVKFQRQIGDSSSDTGWTVVDV
ncbi:hypothetical protein FQZ97_929220 [compost metagenome]